MTAYFFFDVHEIRDPDKAAEYRGQVFATVETYRRHLSHSRRAVREIRG